MIAKKKFYVHKLYLLSFAKYKECTVPDLLNAYVHMSAQKMNLISLNL